ncbi:MAG TPA: FAD-dependent oxidoreductase [Candidatus Sulfomarinibacteraceae bacterium]|nr:FAD-dependent oxidoreductase [Candidatus Sulfomarinibacteraceae bacterium]
MSGASTERSVEDGPACLVVGAGLSGLLAATRLQEAGVAVIVLEAAPVVGGRVATRQIALADGTTATFDHGAQYFTVRDRIFRRWVDDWQRAGVVRRWSDGFATPESSLYRDGQPRYCGQPCMRAIPEHLARDLDVRLASPVRAVSYDQQWSLATEGAPDLQAPALIMTPPTVQALALMDAGDAQLPPEARSALGSITYDPCWAVLAVLDGPSHIPAPGGLWPDGNVISWIADNQKKAISEAPSVTIHASPEFSRAHLAADEGAVARRLLHEAQRWLGADVVQYEIRLWPYSIPRQLYAERTLFCKAPGPLAFAGDAFAGPRVEGAALSGLAAAEAVLEHI